MPDFFHSWAFAFIIGCFVGGCFGFLGAAILATSGRASRMEEKMSDEAIYKAAKRQKRKEGCPRFERITKEREERREDCPEFEIATQGKPEND